MNSIQTKTTGDRPIHFWVKLFWAAMVILAMVCSPGLLLADWTRTQTIQLKTGWNAVFLQVQPTDPKPDAVFKDLPVDRVLTYYPQTSSVQFIQSPDEIPFNTSGWHLWVPKSKPEFFLTNLYKLQANHCYLIRSTQDYTWNLPGIPKLQSIRWQPDSFNFVGFHVSEDNPPTVGQLFQNESAFSDASIYNLQDGRWVRMSKDAPVSPGKAYWIYCKGGTEFTGIMGLRLGDGNDQLSFLTGITEQYLEIFNSSASQQQYSIEQLPNLAGDPSVPLSLVTFTPETGRVSTSFTNTGPVLLQAGEKKQIRFVLRLSELNGTQAKSLLKIEINNIRLFVPVLAENQ